MEEKKELAGKEKYKAKDDHKEEETKEKMFSRGLKSGPSGSIQNNSDTNKPKDPEVDTDEGDLVDDKFAEGLGYSKGDLEKAKEYRENILVRDYNNKEFAV